VPIPVTENITDDYLDDFPGNEVFYHQTYVVVDGVTVDYDTQVWEDTDGDDVLELEEWMVTAGIPDGEPDLTAPIDMTEWFLANPPWYDQPVLMDSTINADEYPDLDDALNPNNIWNVDYLDGTEIGGENSWQADWRLETENKLYIDFIDWGNPLENTVYPIVGQRFPVEMALYEKVASTLEDDTWGETMTAYQVNCIEYPSTRDEVFGTSELNTGSFTKEIAFATVLTNKFFAEVWDPKGGITQIPIEPGMGPSGKLNFASAGGGWTPEMPGWHRIWMHFNDPLITLEGAIVNNDEHYIMSSGYMAEPLSKNKEELVGIVGDSTFVDVYVQEPSGKKPKKVK